MQKVLQVLGVLALVGWTALGGLAWAQVKDGVHVTVREGDGEGGSSEFTLLEDRLSTLSGDLDTLVASLERNFGLLAEALQERGDVEGPELARLEERLRQLEAALPAALEARETAGALRGVLDRLEALDRRLATTAPALDPPALDPLADPGPGVGTREPRPQPVAEHAPEVPVTGAPQESAPPAKKSFLAFSLPSRDFVFEGRQAFEVLGSLSRVGFDAKSTLHDFSGVSDAVEGRFEVDLAHPQAGIEGRVAIETTSLGTDLAGRDEAMHEHLAAEEHTEIVFEPTAFEAGKIEAAEKRLSGTMVGKLTIRGVTREVRMPVEAHVDDSRRLVVEGEMPLSLEDYEVPVPSKLGMINMNKEVRVWIHLRARAKTGGER